MENQEKNEIQDVENQEIIDKATEPLTLSDIINEHEAKNKEFEAKEPHTPPKRGRGRPKGSKNKKTIEKEKQNEVEELEVEEVEEVGDGTGNEQTFFLNGQLIIFITFVVLPKIIEILLDIIGYDFEYHVVESEDTKQLEPLADEVAKTFTGAGNPITTYLIISGFMIFSSANIKKKRKK